MYVQVTFLAFLVLPINKSHCGKISVPFEQGGRIDFTYLITKKYVGDEVVLEVLRNSKKQEFTIKLATHKQFKPGNILGRPISYYIVAGLVFTTLSYRYLEALVSISSIFFVMI